MTIMIKGMDIEGFKRMLKWCHLVSNDSLDEFMERLSGLVEVIPDKTIEKT